MFKAPLFLKINEKLATTISRMMAFISLVLFAVSASTAPPDSSEGKAVLKPASVCSHKEKTLELKKNEQIHKVVLKMRKTFLDFFSNPPANGENKQSEKESLKLLKKQLAPYKIEYNKNPKEFVRQAFYIQINIPKNRANRREVMEGWAEVIFWSNFIGVNPNRPRFFPFTPSPDVQIEVISPYLCSTDKKIAELAFDWMRLLILSRKLKPRVLSPFKAYLKKHKNDLPLKLVDFLYSVDSKESLLMMSELLQKNSEAKKLLEIINLKDKKESLDKLSKRSEWWVQLYVLNTIRKDKSLRSPQVIERLEKTKHLLITKEEIDFLKTKIKK